MPIAQFPFQAFYFKAHPKNEGRKNAQKFFLNPHKSIWPKQALFKPA